MKHVDITELMIDHPAPEIMSREEKLLRWATLIRNTRPHHLELYHGLEYMRPHDLANIQVNHTCGNNAFGIAMADPVFNAAGLPRSGALQDIIGFFQLSQNELHEFSCDCGGAIDSERMAGRIENIALRANSRRFGHYTVNVR